MAVLTGAIAYLGSFKNVRHYRNLHDRKIYAGEKGGANRNQIRHNRSFKRTRENMSEFGGCALAVRAIRHGLQSLLPEKADAHFTGRLMKMTKKINALDAHGKRGKRDILFSAFRPALRKIDFNLRLNFSDMIRGPVICSHAVSRERATVSVPGLTVRPDYVPKGATHFRVFHHISVVSDYIFSVKNRRYEPSSPFGGISAVSYSAFTPVLGTLATDLEVVLPLQPGIVLTDDCSVLQCIGIEFYIRTTGEVYLPLRGDGIRVTAVF